MSKDNKTHAVICGCTSLVEFDDATKVYIYRGSYKECIEFLRKSEMHTKCAVIEIRREIE